MSILEKLAEVFIPSEMRINNALLLLASSAIFSASLFLLPIYAIAAEVITSMVLCAALGIDLSSLFLFSLMPSAVFLVLGVAAQIFLNEIDMWYIVLNFLRIAGLTSFSILYIKIADVPSLVTFISRFSKTASLIMAVSIKEFYESAWLMSSLSLIQKINSEKPDENPRKSLKSLTFLLRGAMLNIANELVYSAEALFSTESSIYKRPDKERGGCGNAK